MTYRCPTHDCVFETLTDERKPGALAREGKPAHPAGCHPDCPQRDKNAKTASTSISGLRKIA